MNKSILITALVLLIATAGFAQTKDTQGPNYKNGKISEKYEGNSSILIRENPNQFQGPANKNFKPSNYDMEVIDSNGLQKPEKLTASTENKSYAAEEEGKETIIYRRVETKDMKGKNTQGLKGPAYKNYKP
jgi:hypothetical protein